MNSKEESDDELDISWLNELNTKESYIENTPQQETPQEEIPQQEIPQQEIPPEDTNETNSKPIYQPHIDIHFIFINSDNEIDHFFKETYQIDETNIMKKEQILKIIQSKKNQKDKKFRFNQILQYNVQIQEETFIETIDDSTTKILARDDTYVENLDTLFRRPFLKKINYIDNITFTPSIHIFHPINCLYFIYTENDSIQPTPKPIIKINNQKDMKYIQKRTKKVKFNEDDLENKTWVFNKMNNTKKNKM